MPNYARLALTIAVMIVPCVALPAVVEPPVVEWSRTFDGGDVEFGSAVRETSDGGFAVAGGTMSYSAGNLDVYLLKIGADGSLAWSRTFGGPDTDAAAAVLPEADGGFVIAGATASTGPGFHNALLLKVNASGDAVWSGVFGGDGYDNADAVEPAGDGGYVLAGFTESFGAPGRNMYVVKTDAEGKEVWSGVYGGEEEDAAAAARRTADGGYIVAGYSRSPDTGEPLLYIVKTDDAGTETWSRIYEDYGGAFSISERPGGEGYAVTGSRQWSSVAYTLAIDAQGEEIAARMFPGLDHARAVEDLGEEGAVVFGSRYIPDEDRSEVVILRFDSQGDNLWSLPLAGCDCGAAFRRTADGRCVVADGAGDAVDVRVTLFGRETLPFRRGELDANGVMDIADAICALAYLFGSGMNACTVRAAECPDAADANDDGRVDIADAIRILGSLFSSAGPLPEPAAACGNDETWDDLRCYRSEGCP